MNPPAQTQTGRTSTNRSPVRTHPLRRRLGRTSTNRRHGQPVTRYSNHGNCNSTSSASVMDAASSVICASKPSEPSVTNSRARCRHRPRLSVNTRRIHIRYADLVSITSIFLTYLSKYLGKFPCIIHEGMRVIFDHKCGLSSIFVFEVDDIIKP